MIYQNLQHTQSLRSKILEEYPPGQDANPWNSFSFNNDFTSNLQRVRTVAVSLKVDSTEDRREVDDSVDEERGRQTEVGYTSP